MGVLGCNVSKKVGFEIFGNIKLGFAVAFRRLRTSQRERTAGKNGQERRQRERCLQSLRVTVRNVVTTIGDSCWRGRLDGLQKVVTGALRVLRRTGGPQGDCQ